MVGQSIRHYKIIEQIGAGGMGVVYKAEDTRLGRTVALKFFPESLERPPSYRARLEREARAASRLDHPNVATVYSFEEADGECFICMAHVEGESLREHLSRGRIPVEEALRIAIQVADGLAAAHKQGIIHLDIKPANILINRDGVVKIVDFGLARALSPEAESHLGVSYASTPYMSPEQAWGDPVDERSDVYSLGVVIYEMLSGTPPFTSDHQQELLHSILNESPPVNDFGGDGPGSGIARILSRALQKSPKQRFQGAADFRFELEHARSASGPAKSPIRPTFMRVVPWAAGILIAIVVIASVFAGFRSRRGTSASGHGTTTIEVLRFENSDLMMRGYFSEALSQEIRDRLATLPDVEVILIEGQSKERPDTQFGDAGPGDVLPRYQLTGKLTWLGDPDDQRFRIAITLVKMPARLPTWKETFDVSPGEVFWLYSQISAGVAEALKLQSQRGAGTLTATSVGSAQAYDLYLRARAHLGRGASKENSWSAVELLERSVAMDSLFAPAQAHLAIASTRAFQFGYDTFGARLDRAYHCSERALRLDSTYAMAHVAKGLLLNWMENDRDGALQEYLIAERIDGSDGMIQHSMALLYRNRGDWLDAVSHFKRAATLNPHYPTSPTSLALCLMWHRDYLTAERWFDEAIRRDPLYTAAYLSKARLYVLWDGTTTRAYEVVGAIPTAARNEDVSIFIHWLLLLDQSYYEAWTMLPSLALPPYEVLLERGRYQDYLIDQALAAPESQKPFYDSARIILESAVALRPEDGELWSRLGIAFAGLGDRDAALRFGNRGMELTPRITKDAPDEGGRLYDLARIHVMLGDFDSAAEDLSALLSQPSEYSAALLRKDPYLVVGHGWFRDPRLARVLNHEESPLPIRNRNHPD